jgi:hypothetical protein
MELFTNIKHSQKLGRVNKGLLIYWDRFVAYLNNHPLLQRGISNFLLNKNKLLDVSKKNIRTKLKPS